MKSEYLRHEYMWSNHGITGNVLGWGIAASSCPKEKEMLRELEKIASMAEPERTKGIPVEELSYSPVCGFVKMVVIPWDSGEDNRKNKKVFLYQTKDNADSPDVYMAPEGEWTDLPIKGYLPPVQADIRNQKPEDIFIEMGVYDRLPDFLRAVFWCLFEKKQGLNFVAPSWEEDQFAANAGRLMYAIHSILPQCLRKRAGYVSYTEQALNREPFYFSKSPCAENSMTLSAFGEQDFPPASSKLEEYFFYHLAELFVKKDPLYNRFWMEAEDFLKTNTGANEEKKLYWLFYRFCQMNQMEPLKKRELLSGIPELFYWGCGDRMLAETAELVKKQIHKGSFTQGEKNEYLRILLEGFTKRAEEPICEELDWLLGEENTKNKERFQEQISVIQEKYPVVYALLLTKNAEKKGTWQHDIFQKSTHSFDQIQEYVNILEKTEIPSDQKDQIILAGIHLLNQDLFKKENYVQFDALMLRLTRKEQWVEILKDFVKNQLEPEAENLDNKSLKTACYVEQLLKKYAPKEVSGSLIKEWNKRQKADLSVVAADAKGQEVKTTAIKTNPVKKKTGTYKDILVWGYPQGFLTGCVFYLCNYSLLIGHWKIAIGMAGMWLLLLMNYFYLLMHREKGCPFWKHVGACVIEGYLIEIIASLLLPQKFRIVYFVILGAAALAMQMFLIYRKKREEEG